ncbi:hypothetical protein [Pseudomonas sp. 13B_3.2_Bac1]|uniref:hypothetical protein n=1 Tax=Pseudomonas sp. 13B_3.2_Bac1 TaxID=2971623 RepID=UPI0021C5747B|nr:hypothetical protein [Pseudomonas sp. 13B_3.2_Bac1]MCU1772266.1 hypothetical protein [Pseudomonas sp. 13B_3.2_Bac1]
MLVISIIPEIHAGKRMSPTHGKAFRNGIALCLMTGLLIGCANSNDLMGSLNPNGVGAKKYDEAYLKTTIIRGKTTKSQISQLFGPPMQEAADSDTITNWTYVKSEEGVEKYMNLAHRFVSPETSGQLAQVSSHVSNAQGTLNEVGSVTSGKTTRQGIVLTIYFENDVVQNYSVAR